MGVVIPKWTNRLSQSGDFKKDVMAALGDLEGVEVFHNMVMIATYIRPEKTAGGIIRPQENVQEDVFQGKVGLVVKKGPMAFVDDGSTQFYGQTAEVGDYIVYRPSDAWDMTVRGVHCRLVPDVRIKARVNDPELVF
jgi:co-chaperonin GroES (HSP10)